MKLNEPKIYFRLIALLSSSAIVIIALVLLPSWSDIPITTAARPAIVEEEPSRFFQQLTLEASAAIVWDLENKKILFGKNEDKQLPLASITKIMTALVANDIFSPEELIVISETALSRGGNAGLIVGDSWQAKDLIDYKLTTSSNGAAAAIAEAANKKTDNDFVLRMNQKAQSLELTDTYFINETGLDVGEIYGGSYGSARDVAKLLSYIVVNKPDLMENTTKPTISKTSATGRIYSGNNTNDIVNLLPGLLASKTGYTYNAGGNLAVAVDLGLRQPIVIVVLGSSLDGRFTDVLKLNQATLDYFSS